MAAKGYDDSPPRNGVIFFYSILTVVFLFGAQQLLNSYFGAMMAAELHEKVDIVGLQGAIDAKAHDQAELAKFDIEAAKRLYVQRGRSASPVIAPESGANKAAIGGWSQLKRDVPVAPAAAPAVPDSMPAAAPTNTVPVEAATGAAGGGAAQAPARSGNTSPSAGAGVTTTNTSTGRVPVPAQGGAAPAPAAPKEAAPVGSAGEAKGKP
jgi:hypothetical protein